jgi:hypothetical protein
MSGDAFRATNTTVDGPASLPEPPVSHDRVVSGLSRSRLQTSYLDAEERPDSRTSTDFPNRRLSVPPNVREIKSWETQEEATTAALPRRPSRFEYSTGDVDVESDASPPRRPIGRTRDVTPSRTSAHLINFDGAQAAKDVASDALSSMLPLRKHSPEDERPDESDASPPRRPLKSARDRPVPGAGTVKSAHRRNDEGSALQGDLQSRASASSPLSSLKRFAGTADDAELNDALRKRQRWGDPMRSNDKATGRSNLHLKTATDSGTVAVAVYSGPPAPPNRYGILPGPRWDGVDRSNGFEERLALSHAAASLNADEAFRRNMSGL